MAVWIEKIFLQILNMSLTGIYCVLAVLLVRLLLKKQPKIFSYALWFIVLFRMACPVSFESPFSAFRMTSERVITSQGIENITRVKEMGFGIQEDASADITQIGQNTITDNIDGRNSDISNDNINRKTSESSNQDGKVVNVVSVASIIWIIGMFSMFGYAIISAVMMKRKLKSAEKRAGYYEMEQIDTPFVYGMIRPKIYLPTGLSEQEMCYILEHERTHIRRCDYLIKPMAFFVLCIHWFNPFAWLAFFCMGKDMEMSCDEAVLRKLGKEIKRDYSTSLLKLACGRRFWNGSPLAFGEGTVKSRIKNILNYKKSGFWGILLAVVVLITAGAVLLSNPKTSEKELAEKEQTDSNEKDKMIEGEKKEQEESQNIQGKNETEGDIVAFDSLPVYQKEQEEELKNLLASYGELTFDELHSSSSEKKYPDDMVIIGNTYDDISNLERWNTFYNRTRAGEADAVLIVQYTVEGDAILDYLSYRDGSYYLMNDCTRDKMGPQAYLSTQCPYFNEYCYDGFVEYYLTQEKEITQEEIGRYQLSSAAAQEDMALVFQCPYDYMEECMGTAEVERMRQSDLQHCIGNAVLNHHGFEHENDFGTEAHHVLKIEENNDEVTVYAHILYQSYHSLEEEGSGSYIPTAITFTKGEDGRYRLKEYWTPGDGSYFKGDIEEKFPEDIWEDALGGQNYVHDLRESCHQRAADHFYYSEGHHSYEHYSNGNYSSDHYPNRHHSDSHH